MRHVNRIPEDRERTTVQELIPVSGLLSVSRGETTKQEGTDATEAGEASGIGGTKD